MNDYVMTVLLENHRRDLLDEARNEALARQLRGGREPWWHRLVRRSADAPAEPAGSSFNGHLAAAPLMTTR